jgi:hypothetical protein
MLCLRQAAHLPSNHKAPQLGPAGHDKDVDSILAELIPQIRENIFTRWLTERVSITWLEEDDSRLGMTRFEEGNGNLFAGAG